MNKNKVRKINKFISASKSLDLIKDMMIKLEAAMNRKYYYERELEKKRVYSTNPKRV